MGRSRVILSRRIYGIEIPEPILKKIYRDNAARLLGLEG
jgi:hypothetical protein